MVWKKTGRRREFEKAALEHIDALYGVALRLTRDERDAEDLVQDAYVRALRFYDRFKWGTNMRAWLLRILTNTFINKYHKRQKEKQFADQLEDTPDVDVLLSSDSISQLRDPETRYQQTVLRDELRRAVDELPEDFRMAVVLADVYGFSYREIASILDCPIGTVMSRLHRARKTLQSRLVDQAISAGVLPSVIDGDSPSSKLESLEAYRKRRTGGAS